jgi:hypothetical protein
MFDKSSIDHLRPATELHFQAHFSFPEFRRSQKTDDRLTKHTAGDIIRQSQIVTLNSRAAARLLDCLRDPKTV